MFNTFNGLELKLLRLFNGLSLEDVAIKVEKSKQYIHKLETGLSYPTDDLLKAYVTYLMSKKNSSIKFTHLCKKIRFISEV